MNRRQKKKQIKMRNKKLVKRYPFLRPRYSWYYELLDDYDYSWTEYDSLDNGWKVAFGEFLLEDLRNACLKTDFLNKLQIVQWKEKFGSMRLYVNDAPLEVYDVIRDYEFISEHICIECGSPHACVVNGYGWYLPYCKECWDKKNKCRKRKGLSVKSWEEVSNESDIDIPNEYKVEKYSVNGNETITYDISETANKIKKKYKKRNNK